MEIALIAGLSILGIVLYAVLGFFFGGVFNTFFKNRMDDYIDAEALGFLCGLFFPISPVILLIFYSIRLLKRMKVGNIFLEASKLGENLPSLPGKIKAKFQRKEVQAPALYHTLMTTKKKFRVEPTKTNAELQNERELEEAMREVEEELSEHNSRRR